MNLPKLRERLRSSFLGRVLLGALSLGYGAGLWIHRGQYALGFKKRRKLSARTICIGNLTAGGTGKTPAVLLAVEDLAKHRLKAAVLTRGYRRAGDRRTVVLADGSDELSGRAAGDEPWMLRQLLRHRGTPVVVGADRYEAGALAVRRFAPDVVLMDDGFQHWGLERDLDVVLVNARDPFGGGRLLPLGLLREPASGLARAGLILLTHVDHVEKERLRALREELARLSPGTPVAESIHKPEFLLDLRTNEKLPLARLKGRGTAALSAIGDPESFERQLSALGAGLEQAWRFPDHHPYVPRELKSIENARGERTLVTTLKDVPRLPKGWERIVGGDVYALAIRLKITRGQEDWQRCLCSA